MENYISLTIIGIGLVTSLTNYNGEFVIAGIKRMRKRASALSESFCRMFIMNSEEEWLGKSIKKIKNSFQN